MLLLLTKGTLLGQDLLVMIFFLVILFPLLYLILDYLHTFDILFIAIFCMFLSGVGTTLYILNFSLST